MREKILEFFRKNPDSVSFVELSRIDGFSGDQAWYLKNDKVSGILLWGGISNEFLDAFDKLRADKIITMNSASVLVYAIDGQMPALPVAKHARHYKKEHWMPVVFSLDKIVLKAQIA